MLRVGVKVGYADEIPLLCDRDRIGTASPCALACCFIRQPMQLENAVQAPLNSLEVVFVKI